MTTFNTTSPQQSIGSSNYRGSYTMHLTPNQFQTIMGLARMTKMELSDIWKAWFDEDYDVNNWRSISVNAASEIIGHLHEVRMKLLAEQAFMRKIQRTEQEQHDYEMGW